MQLQTDRTIISQFPQYRRAGDNLLPSMSVTTVCNNKL